MNIQRVFNGFTYSKPKNSILYVQRVHSFSTIKPVTEEGCNMFLFFFVFQTIVFSYVLNTRSVSLTALKFV